MPVRHPSRRRSVIALVILAVVLIAMAVVIRNSGGGQPLADPTASPTTSLPANPTLLVQLRDDGLTNVDNVVMGLDTRVGTGAQQYLPQNLVVDLVDGRDETLGLTGFKPIQQAAPLVSNQTGAAVADTFVMDRLAFAGLVDSVGGVTIDLPQPLIVRDRYGNVTTIVPLGERTLDGPSAAVYALYLGPGQPESERQARFQVIWEAVLAELPASADQMRAILGGLGALARTTESLADLADFLVAAGQVYRASAMTSAQLPVTPGAFGPLPLAWIDPAATAAQVTTLFPASVIAADQPPLRVRVYRAGATTAAVEKARSELTLAGQRFVWAGPTPARPNSLVAAMSIGLVPEAERVAQTIGLPASTVVVDPAATPGAPVTVLLAPAPTATGTETPAATGTASPAVSDAVTSSDQ